jgi:DNA-binding SARP family transcriptional activator
VAGRTKTQQSEPLTLELRLFGELCVMRDGRPVALPASKKTRALLAYLVTTGRPHTRESLCDLLWEGPDDPRAALRWSLAKLRPLLDEEGAVRLVADRERVVLDR